MSLPGYKHLIEDIPEPGELLHSGGQWTATFDDDEVTNKTKKIQSSSSNGAKAKKPEQTSQGDKAKYTPLSKTSVHELGAYEDECVDGINMEHDINDKDSIVFDSTVCVNNDQTIKTRFKAVLCGLLTASVALVGFALIYAFVILPAHSGQILYPDGDMHTEDLAKLRKLGQNVAFTSCGIVQGEMEDGAYVFRGIPYGLPPVKGLRWKPPKPLTHRSNTCWRGIFNATTFGNKCAQPNFSDPTQVEGSENCLFINVWSPSLNPNLELPVIVWLHSGDFVYGSGNTPGVSPSGRLAVDTNAVYVSFNYRLGAFGFLALDELRSGEEKASGNYGIMDQILALHWVKENIGHFGGSQNQITLLGHGSGATSIQALLSSPFSTGLFSAAWMASPVPVLNKTLREACHDNKVFKDRSGCSSVNCMRKMTPQQVMTSSPWSLQPRWTLDQLMTPERSQLRNDLIIFDGYVIHYSKAKEGPYGPNVPVVFGTSYFDLSNMEDEQHMVNLTWDGYNDIIVHYVSNLGTDAALQALRLYSKLPALQYSSPAHFPAEPSAHLARMIGDVKNICPLKTIADAHSYVHSSPSYLYVAELYPSHNMVLSESLTSSFVGWELLAFFNGFSDLSYQVGQSDVNFQNVIRREVLSFARTGKPDAARWKQYPKGVGIIGRGVTVAAASQGYFSKCSFWKQHGFFKYSWSI